MANKIVYTDHEEVASGDKVITKYLDNGDGTYSQGIAITNVDPVYVSVGTSVEISNDTGNPIPVDTTQRTCLGMQKLSVTTSAVSTLTVPTGALGALIQADGSTVYVTLDTTSTPDSSTGIRLDDGQLLYIDSSLQQVKLIAKTQATIVQVAYFNKV